VIDNLLTQQLKVLYIEDDHMTRDELSRYLKKRVGKLFSAESCEQGLELLNTESIDLILIDLHMPGMTGLQLIRNLRARSILTPVIITSAFSDSNVILEAIDLGIVKYIVKPIDLDQLLLGLSEVSTSLLKSKGLLVFNDKPLLDREMRLSLEKQIKSEIAHQLKQLTGKGPKDVLVLLKSNAVEIQILECLTLIEQQLMQSSNNTSLVIAFRRAFYESACSILCSSIENLLGSKTTLNQVKIDPASSKDVLIFDLC
jgi:DNA-binding response OmpR family regulator